MTAEESRGRKYRVTGEEPGGLRVAAMAAYEEKTRARRRGEEDRKTQDTHRGSLERLLRESNRWPIAS